MASQRDFLMDCSVSLILDHAHTLSSCSGATWELQDVVQVKLEGFLMKNVDHLGFCTALRICILSENFITDVQPLMQCVDLLKLDLRGNQISQLPDSSCWRNLKNLQLLYLHDNMVTVLKDISGLSTCKNLTALTLYDTPLSLRPNYRHNVVNTICSLKSLDQHIISDEEIIQNWHLPPKYRALSPHLCVNLYPSVSPDSYEAELKLVYGIISEINRIQALFSPTLIIQKWIRGFLTRKHLRLDQNVEPERNSGEQHEWSRKSWMRNQLHLEDVMSFRNLNCEVLKDLITPCNTPQSNQHPPKHNVCVMDLNDGLMDSFHLLGIKATIHLSDPITDLLVSQKNAGQNIRDAIRHFHMVKPNPPAQPHPRPPNITVGQCLATRCHDCLNLTRFQEIDKGYQKKQKAEELLRRMEHVEQLHNQRDDAQDHHRWFVEVQRREALLRQERAREDMQKTLHLQKVKRERDMGIARQRNLNFLQEKERRRSEQEMVEHFIQQHNVMDKTLKRHRPRQRLEQQTPTNKVEHLENRKQKIQISIHNLLIQSEESKIPQPRTRAAQGMSGRYEVDLHHSVLLNQPARPQTLTMHLKSD